MHVYHETNQKIRKADCIYMCKAAIACEYCYQIKLFLLVYEAVKTTINDQVG